MQKRKITELERKSVHAFKDAPKLPLVVVLDNVRSLNNVGSVFRTSDAFLVEKIVLCGITSTPPNNEIHKTALGAEDAVDWEYVEHTSDAVKLLREDGYTVFAIEQVKGSVMLDELVLKSKDKYAIVLGHEVKGVQQAVVDMCDACIEIPQFGTKHSLNVSVTGGMLIWEFYRQLKGLQ